MEFLFVQANDPTSLPEAVVLLDFEGERRADLAKLAPFIYDSGTENLLICMRNHLQVKQLLKSYLILPADLHFLI